MTAASPIGAAYEAVIADYERKLEGLESKRIELVAMIAALRTSLAEAGGATAHPAHVTPSAPPDTAPVKPLDTSGSFEGMKIPDATKRLLENEKRPMSNREIATALRAGGIKMSAVDPNNTIGSVVTRRSNRIGDIVKVAPGIWGLKGWKSDQPAATSG